MATVKGYNGSLRDSAGNLIGELTSFTLTITQNSEQHNAFGDAWIDTTATNKNWSVEGSGMFDPNDTKHTLWTPPRLVWPGSIWCEAINIHTGLSNTSFLDVCKYG